MLMTITRTFHFAAMHHLPNTPSDHKCHRVHGHNYTAEVELQGEIDPHTGWIVDYAEIDRIWKATCGELDHNSLNDIEGLENPTAEILAIWIFERIIKHLPISTVTVKETAHSSARVSLI